MASKSKIRGSESDNNTIDYDDLWTKDENANSSAPGIYLRNEPENEIDLLWSGVKEHHSFRSSPLFSLIVGFILGVIATISVGAILFWGNDIKPFAFGLDTNQSIKKSDVSVPSSGTSSEGDTTASSYFKDIQKYTIQPGDSLGKIAEKFYQSSSPEKLELIKKANNLTSANSIIAGQTLIIPVETVQEDQQATEQSQ